jgi:hypothetical protein
MAEKRERRRRWEVMRRLFPTFQDFIEGHPQRGSHIPYDGPMPACINFPVDPWSPTSRWHGWRDLLGEIIGRYPDNPNLRADLRHAENVLTWRAALPAEDHFWAEG